MTESICAAVHRDLAGIRIDGEHYAVRLHPCNAWKREGDPSVAVSVHAMPIDDAERGINLPTTRAFSLADIELASTGAEAELRCLRALEAGLECRLSVRGSYWRWSPV